LASQKLLELLNKGIARELQVSIQYMWQHVQVTGIDGAVVKSTFKEISARGEAGLFGWGAYNQA
jgi:bacterioferritin